MSKNDHQKIIITDYKNFKKYQNRFTVINGYQYDRDIIYFLKNNYNISDESLINYCLSLPYFTLSEATKYKANKTGYITDAKSKGIDNFILKLKDIFRKKSLKLILRNYFLKLKMKQFIKNLIF